MERKKILIVGEIGTMAGELILRLREEGYAILGIAESGQEALEIAEKNPFDAALIDAQLRGRLNAAAVASHFMEHLASNPAILYLTFSVQDLPTHPDAEYVMKPVAFNELVSKLDHITRRYCINAEPGCCI